MIEDVLDIPNQIRDALWRVDSARLESKESAGLAVCGMGGSAIGGELALGLLGERLTGPVAVVSDYRLPTWISADWAVLASSYSGETEETLSAFREAGELGTHRWAAGTGGRLGEEAREAGLGVVGLPGFLQPRAAVAYMTVVACHAAERAGIAPDIRSELKGAADFLDGAKDDLRKRAAGLAGLIGDSPVVIHGGGPTVPVARRWATQFNENAKQFAFAVEIPEADHNLIEAWGDGSGGLGAVFLTDRDQLARVRKRMDLTAGVVDRSGAPAVSVEAEGGTPADRLFWSVMLGDLVSVAVAEARGADSGSVETLEGFKQEMGEP